MNENTSSAPVDDLLETVKHSPFYALTEAYNRGVDYAKKSTQTSSLSTIEDCINKAVAEWIDNSSYEEIKELIILPYLKNFHKKCHHRSISLFDMSEDKA